MLLVIIGPIARLRRFLQPCQARKSHMAFPVDEPGVAGMGLIASGEDDALVFDAPQRSNPAARFPAIRCDRLAILARAETQT